jgi:hypothetical protein
VAVVEDAEAEAAATEVMADTEKAVVEGEAGEAD